MDYAFNQFARMNGMVEGEVRERRVGDEAHDSMSLSYYVRTVVHAA